MKQTLLTCIEIAQNKGILFNESDLNKAKEYVENMLDEKELNLKIDELDTRLKLSNGLLNCLNEDIEEYRATLKVIEMDLRVKEKLMKQRELLRCIIILLDY